MKSLFSMVAGLSILKIELEFHEFFRTAILWNIHKGVPLYSIEKFSS